MENGPYETREERRERIVDEFLEFLKIHELRVVRFVVKEKHSDGRMNVDISLPDLDDFDKLVKEFSGK